METRLIGDMHCAGPWPTLMTENCIQIGDLCLLDYNKYVYEDGKPRYFIDGNHDYFPALNPDAEKPYRVTKDLVYIPRGYVSGNVLFVGGADCVPWDRQGRTPGWDWFPEETLNQGQLERILAIDEYENDIEVVIAHECPFFLIQHVLNFAKGGGNVYNLQTPKHLEMIYNKFQPRYWYFGHYHCDFEATIMAMGNFCTFKCINTHRAVDIELPLAEDFFELF